MNRVIENGEPYCGQKLTKLQKEIGKLQEDINSLSKLWLSTENHRVCDYLRKCGDILNADLNVLKIKKYMTMVKGSK